MTKARRFSCFGVDNSRRGKKNVGNRFAWNTKYIPLRVTWARGMDVFITLEEHKDTVSRTISEHPALDNSQIDRQV